MKVTVIGVGNIGGAIARGLAKGSILKASDITCTDLVQENLDKMLQANNSFIISKNNLEAVKSETDEVEQCKMLSKIFGDDFPIPEKKNAAKKQMNFIPSTSASGVN